MSSSRQNVPSLTAVDPAVRAAQVALPPDGDAGAEAALASVTGCVAPPPGVPWSRMSFRDHTARDVAAAVRKEGWNYHDQITGHRLGGGTGQARTDRLTTRHATDDAVFFDDDGGWTLRYQPGRLPRYGFPASVLLENSWPETRTFAVAAPTERDDGVWLESSPGRVVELRGSLVAAPGGASAQHLRWSDFAPGDEVVLSQASSTDDGWTLSLHQLVLRDWAPSVRGALGGAKRILLPVLEIDADAGGLRLGSGQHQVTVPIGKEQAETVAGAQAVWLDRRNDVGAATATAPGDVVLVGTDQVGALSVLGHAGTEVRLAHHSERNWAGTVWLQRILQSPSSRRDLLQQLGGAVPMTVSTVGDGSVTVSRERQPAGRWPESGLLRTTVVAALGDRVVMRHGSALYLAAATDVVRGLQPSCATAAAQELARLGTVVWWWGDEEGRPITGLGPRPCTDAELQVEVESTVEAHDGTAAGFVCRHSGSQELRWLPAGHAAWVHDLPAAELLGHLRDRGSVSVRALHDKGRVSITLHPAVTQRLRSAQAGDAMRVTIAPGKPRVDETTSSWRRVAVLETPTVILSHVSLSPASVEPGDSVLAEIDEVRRSGAPSVVVVPRESRRIVPDLPLWLLDAQQHIHLGTSRRTLLVPRRYSDYKHWYGGTPTAGGGTGTAVRDLVTAAGQMDDGEQVDIGSVIQAWLASENARAAFGLDFNRDVRHDVDAVEMLTAVRLLAAAPGRHRAAAVALLHQVGWRATASLHTEAFVREWVKHTDRHTRSGMWMRLRELPLSSESDLSDAPTGLDPADARRVREFCLGVLARPAFRGHESAIAPVALSLLAALGELDSMEKVLPDAHILGRMRVWAHALQPAAGSATAQAALLPSQLEEVRALLRDLLITDLPLALLPPPYPLEPPTATLIEEVLNPTRLSAGHPDR